MPRVMSMWVEGDCLQLETADGIEAITDPKSFFVDIPGHFGERLRPQYCIHIWTNNTAELVLYVREYCPDLLGIWSNGIIYPVWQAGGFRTWTSGGVRVILMDLRAFALEGEGREIWKKAQIIEDWLKDAHNEAFTAGMLAKNLYNNSYYYTKQMRAVCPDRLYVSYPSVISRALRSAYHGGRVEAIAVGEYRHDDGDATLWHVDINSLYPYIMMSGNIPLSYCGEERDPTINLRARKGYKFGLVDCSGYIRDDCPFGPLPVIGEHGLEYPVGDFEGIYTIDEIRGAQDWIEDLEIRYVWWWRSYDLFGGWVRYWYPQKQQGNPIAKIMLNSLYGKFAQHVPAQTRYISATDAWTEDNQSPELWAKRTNPVISTAITARGRMLLWHAMLRWHAAGGRVLYVDTDSIWGYLPHGIVPQDVLRVSPSRLGNWKIVDDCKETMVIYGRKMYVTDEEVRRMAGLPTRAMRKGRWYEWEIGPEYDDFAKVYIPSRPI